MGNTFPPDVFVHVARDGRIIADGEYVGHVERTDGFPAFPWRAELFVGQDNYRSAYARTRKEAVAEVMRDA